MKISVIIPVFNAEVYLKRCLDSVINQTYRNLEIILINDGSTDSSDKICDEYKQKDNRIIVIHQENKGQSAARNKGLDISTGDFVGFVDADDFIDEKMYEKLMYSLKDRDLAICDYQLIKSNLSYKLDSSESISTVLFTYNQIWEEILIRLNNAVWNKLFKRKLINQLRFREDLHHGEDMMFNLEYLINCSSAVMVKQTLYYYCRNASSVTSSSFSEKKLSEVVSKDKILSFVINNNPLYINYAKLLCFKARMNVLRLMYSENKDSHYKDVIKKYKQELKELLKDVKYLLKLKEKLEYFLLENVKALYVLVNKLYSKKKRRHL